MIGRSRTVIALESRLRACRNVHTLGVKPNFSDYPATHRALIRAAQKVYYPSSFYIDLFDAMGKSTFPSYHNYKCAQDKIKQTALFHLVQIPHPRTRVFYGKRQKSKITTYFSYPFIAKIPRGSAMGRGVFLIRNRRDLQTYCNLTQTAYIQEYLPVDRDVRVTVIGRNAAHAYWRIAAAGEFRSNLALGGRVHLDNVPRAAIELAVETARRCGFNDVGIDVCFHDDRPYVLEANMKYGRQGFRQAGLDYHRLMEQLIANGQI